MTSVGKKAWIIILCAAAISTINLGVRQSFGLFMKPISMDLEVGRQVLSLALAIATLITGFATPFFGALPIATAPPAPCWWASRCMSVACCSRPCRKTR